MGKLKNLLKDLSLLITTICFCLFFLEIFIIYKFPDWISEENSPYIFYSYDSNLGWVNTKNSHGGIFKRPEFEYEININSNGGRDDEFKTPNEKLDIAVLGDSFVWGVGVEYGKRFTELIEESNLNVNDVRNYGVSGYGQIHNLIQIKENIVNLEDIDLLILTVCLSNDLEDNVLNFRHGYHKPYAELNKNSLEIKGIPVINNNEITRKVEYYAGLGLKKLYKKIKTKVLEWRAGILYPTDFYTFDENLSQYKIDKINQMYEVFESIVEEIFRISNKSNTKIVVLFAPTKFEIEYDVDEPSKVRDNLSKILQNKGINFIDPTEKFDKSDFWEIDGHWKEKGHRKIAEELKNYLNNFYQYK
jgi:lysophospholipase L1-like esterase